MPYFCSEYLTFEVAGQDLLASFIVFVHAVIHFFKKWGGVGSTCSRGFLRFAWVFLRRKILSWLFISNFCEMNFQAGLRKGGSLGGHVFRDFCANIFQPY